MESLPASTEFFRFPRTESCFNRWARVPGSVMSFTATYSISGCASDARKMFRPILPNPLIPTRTFMTSVPPGLVMIAVRKTIALNSQHLLLGAYDSLVRAQKNAHPRRGEHARKKRIGLTMPNRQNLLIGVYFFGLSLS